MLRNIYDKLITEQNFENLFLMVKERSLLLPIYFIDFIKNLMHGWIVLIKSKIYIYNILLNFDYN